MRGCARGGGATVPPCTGGCGGPAASPMSPSRSASSRGQRGRREHRRGPSGREPHRSPLPSWHVAATLALGTGQAAVDCPDADTCWALESGHLLSSADGGLSWSDRTALVPEGHRAHRPRLHRAAAVCARRDRHVRGRAGAVRSTTRGHRPSGSGSDDGVHRPVVHDRPCGASASPAWRRSSPWTPASPGTRARCRAACSASPTSTASPGRRCVTPWATTGWYRPCSAPTTAAAAGRCRRRRGTTVASTASTVPARPTASRPARPTSDYALVVHTTDGGQHWNLASTPSHPYPLRSVSCVTASRCTAIGQSPGNTPFVFATTDGQQWSEQPVPAIASPSRPRSSARPPRVRRGGGRVRRTRPPTRARPGSRSRCRRRSRRRRSLTCATAMTCLAAGTDAAGRPFVLRSADGGDDVGAGRHPAGGGRPSAVDCPTAQTCFALAVVDVAGTPRDKSQLWRSTDGGRSWADPQPAHGVPRRPELPRLRPPAC